jgi:hypothetical protein
MNKNIVTYIIAIIVLLGCENRIHQGIEKSLPDIVDFNFHIKPILSDRCFSCHGPDDNAREGDVRLDAESSAFNLLDTLNDIYIIKPADLEKSELYRRIINSDSEQIMPPPESHLSLSEDEIELIKKWIEQGSDWKPHWAFIQPKKKTLPVVNQMDWLQNDIDYFVLSKLENLNIKPSNKARKEKLIRRISFDLTGLPPDLKSIDAFLFDNSSNALEKLIDKYLESEAYGERMATEWLDLSRYAETNGIHHDLERNMWPWRDWVIKAFNENMSYDQFVTWQLAGDLLPEPNYEQQLATAFNRNNRTTQECGSLDEEFRVSYVVDRTNTFGKAFLGLTLECAQCHDHKYDPISQKEYYQLFAFFNQVPEKGVTQSFPAGISHNQQSAPFLELPEGEVKRIRNYIDAQIESEYASGSVQDEDKSYMGNWKEEMEAMLLPVMIMKEKDSLRPTYVLDRGLYDSPGEKVSFGTPTSIVPFNSNLPENRLGLAKWLFDPKNPLTARVAVNRYWQMIFEKGLVDTPDDFGSQGSIPTHPALLDWLAVEFMESGWDVKRLLKTIIMSATYQQASSADEHQITFDPENKWLGRGTQQRLTAEMLRDQALTISGLLHQKIGGPSVKPYQPEGLWTQVSSGGRFKRKYMTSQDMEGNRRSIYTYWKRIQPPPSMIIFDAASRNQCNVKRQSTNTPLQALVLLNDPQFVEASKALGQRMLKEGGNNLKKRIEFAFRWATSRNPELDELNILEGLYNAELEEFQKYPDRAADYLQIPDLNKNENKYYIKLAAYGVVANAIINLSESLQKN